jgi:hypothetical protein
MSQPSGTEYLSVEADRKKHAELVQAGIDARKESDARAKAAHAASLAVEDATQRPTRSGTECEDHSVVVQRLLNKRLEADRKATAEHAQASVPVPLTQPPAHGRVALDVNQMRRAREPQAVESQPLLSG